MSGADRPAPTAGGRRAPPPFRRAEVASVLPLTARLTRVTLAGPDLQGFQVEQPASSIRVLLGAPARPTW